MIESHRIVYLDNVLKYVKQSNDNVKRSQRLNVEYKVESAEAHIVHLLCHPAELHVCLLKTHQGRSEGACPQSSIEWIFLRKNCFLGHCACFIQ